MRSFHITNSPEQSHFYYDRESEKRFEPWYMTPLFLSSTTIIIDFTSQPTMGITQRTAI